MIASHSKQLLPLVLFLIATSIACNRPKVIEQEGQGKETGIFSDENTEHHHHHHAQNQQSNQLHMVVVQEVLYATKYVYLYVNENDESYWIAANKREANKGDVFYYRGGLLKTDFYSTEHKRLFEKIYLVTKLVTEDHGQNQQPIVEESKTGTSPSDVIQHPGDVLSISELVKNSKSYEGKTVTLKGKCSKVNHSILDRNWIHLKDGSMDDFDLVITSNSVTEVGELITVKAKVSLNRDFGAGYVYDIILEDGIILK